MFTIFYISLYKKIHKKTKYIVIIKLTDGKEFTTRVYYKKELVKDPLNEFWNSKTNMMSSKVEIKENDKIIFIKKEDIASIEIKEDLEVQNLI